MSIYIGVGGWVFEEWRDNFYPRGLSQKRELEYASSRLTAIEINGTYYVLAEAGYFCQMA